MMTHFSDLRAFTEYSFVLSVGGAASRVRGRDAKKVHKMRSSGTLPTWRRVHRNLSQNRSRCVPSFQLRPGRRLKFFYDAR